MIILAGTQWVAADDAPPVSGPPRRATAVSRAAPGTVVGEGEIVRGWMGLDLRDFTPPPPNPYHVVAIYGALVNGVTADGPAAQAGLLPGDVVTHFFDRPVATAEALNRAVLGTAPGTVVDLVVLRNGNELKLTAEVGRLDDRLLVVAGPPPAAEDLGLVVANPVSAGERGVVVTTVSNGSLAAEAGLRPDDVIVSVQGHPVRNADQYLALLDHRDLLTRSVQLGVRSAGGTEREVYLAPAAG